MSVGFARADNSLVARWWWTVDRWSLAAIAALIAIGAILAMASTPPVAEKLGLEPFYFVRRQFLLLPVAIGVMLGVSLLDLSSVRRVAAFTLLAAVALLALTFVVGAEIKGARRWINLPGFSLQPSEFVKPSFAVIAAWLFALQRRQVGVPGDLIAIALYATVLVLLLLQPDVGMAVVVSSVWFAQYFLAGLRMLWVLLLGGAGAGALTAAYFFFPHVQSRINRFLDPSSGDTYQVTRSLEAFTNGGLSGRGPGEGTVKTHLPDAHSDFVFAVAGEEFGLIACLAIVLLFAFVVLRGFGRLLSENNLFAMLATAGLLVQFGLQAIINMGSTLHLLPTKGMTLPFISYGGSSLLALSLGMGFVLALSRKRYGPGEGE
ncbi:MAG: putative lipid II flippase FtsW [Alphaproteobacteria bacterium]|nr:putative lipid II flippase FtsW [Alphaproteobacteria bacterium]